MKQRGAEKTDFTLQTTPGLPQSGLDKRIFDPDWKLRAGWTLSEIKSSHGVFRPKIFCFTKNGETYNEDDLAVERYRLFDYRLGQGVFAPRVNPPAKVQGRGGWR